MVIERPPMGWNSWNTYGWDINEDIVKSSADALVDSGLAECGYEYIVLDDCWHLSERNSDGEMVPDPAKFPSGMKALGDYIHSKGLKFGMYSCAGNLTCAGLPGSFEHEWTDARKFAEWGVDLLKYDFCFHPATIPAPVLYRRMALALQNSGRDILFSACSWGADETKHWIKSTGANMWRSTGDIFDSWASLKDLSLKAHESLEYSGINCFMDMDMLTVGMRGNGNVGLGGMTDDEYRLHFAYWALMGSPLMIGCDIRNMDAVTKSILTNRDIIAINQDAAGNMPFSLNAGVYSNLDEWVSYARILENGDIAIGIFNFSDIPMNRASTARVNTDLLGIPESTGKTLLLTDLYTGEKTRVTNGIMLLEIPAHSCKLYRAEVIDK